MSEIRSAIAGALKGVKSGLTTGEVADLLPDHDWKKVTKAVANMAQRGLLVRHEGENRFKSRYTLNPDKAPASAPAPAKKKTGRKAKRAYRIKGTTRATAQNALRVTANATQIGGDHYRSKAVQPWDAMSAWFTPEEFRGFLKGNAIKYIARERDKGGTEDLRKAQHYLGKLIEVAA